MQGAIEEENSQPTLIDRIKSTYENRKPFSEFTKIEKVSIPQSLNTSVDRIKTNIPKFAFYYLMILLSLDIFFVLFNNILVFPIAITAGIFYYFYEPKNIKGYEITRVHAALASLVLNLVICIIFRSLASRYVYLFALNAFGVGIILAHGSLLDPTEEQEEDKV